MADYSVLNHLDGVSVSELRNFLQQLKTAPNYGSGDRVEGQMWYFVGDGKLYFRDSSAVVGVPKLSANESVTGVWNWVPTSGTVPFTVDAAKNSVVTNLNADMVDGYHATTALTVSTVAARDASNQIMVATTPTDDNHAASKSYVDSTAQGLTPKEACRGASTANFAGTYVGSPTFTLTKASNGSINAEAGVDGITYIAADRILLKDQTDAAENGIYDVTTVGDGSNPWVLTRASDSDTDAEVDDGTYVSVEEGTANSGTGWFQSTVNPVLDTDDLVYLKLFSPVVVVAGAGMTKSGNTLNVITAAAARIVVNADDIDLATTAVTPAAYGTASQVGSFTVDAYGRLTAASNVAISIAASAVTSGTLAIARGGTNTTTIAAAGALPYSDGSAFAWGSVGTSGQFLRSGGSGVYSWFNLFSTANTWSNHQSLGPYGAGAGQTSEIRFLELAASGTNYVGFKSPDTLAGNQIWVLPTADGSPNHYLKTNGSGTLSFNQIAYSELSGTPTVSGSTNYLAKFTAATTIGDSAITEDGTTIASALRLDIDGRCSFGTNNSSNDDYQIRLDYNLTQATQSDTCLFVNPTITVATTSSAAGDTCIYGRLNCNAAGTHSGKHRVISSRYNLDAGDPADVVHFSTWIVDTALGTTITNLFHFQCDTFTINGSITNQYVIYAPDLTQATNNWFLYSLGSGVKSYHAGNFHIGSTSGSSLLNVGSSAQLTVGSTGNLTTSGDIETTGDYKIAVAAGILYCTGSGTAIQSVSGTADRVVRWATNTTIGASSKIWDDGTSVSIGATPNGSALFQVQGGPVVMDNNQALEMRVLAGTRQEVLKLNASDVLILNNKTGGTIQFADGGTVNMQILGDGNVAIGNITPTGYLHIKSGTGAASTGQLKFTSGTILSSPELGVLEFNGDLYFTRTGPNRAKVSLVKTATIGDGLATAIDVTHNLGTNDIQVEVYRNSSPYDTVLCSVERKNTNEVTLRFASAPTSNQYNVVITG